MGIMITQFFIANQSPPPPGVEHTQPLPTNYIFAMQPKNPRPAKAGNSGLGERRSRHAHASSAPGKNLFPTLSNCLIPQSRERFTTSPQTWNCRRICRILWAKTSIGRMDVARFRTGTQLGPRFTNYPSCIKPLLLISVTSCHFILN